MMSDNPHFGSAIDALLAIEQGFELEYVHPISRNKRPFDRSDVFFFLKNGSIGGFAPDLYPTPETAHLLEPQVGDLVLSDSGQAFFWRKGDLGEIGDPAIIQRNGKPFPKVVGGV